MPTKRNRRVGVQSRKVKKPKNVSRKLSVSGKAKKRRSSAHGSSTRRRVQRGGDPLFLGIPLPFWVIIGAGMSVGLYAVGKAKLGKKREAPSGTGDVGEDS